MRDFSYSDGVLKHEPCFSLPLNELETVSFMHGVQRLKDVVVHDVDENVANSRDALVKHLLKCNYRLLVTTKDFEVYGCFSDIMPDLLMLEIVYYTKGSTHVNIPIKFE